MGAIAEIDVVLRALAQATAPQDLVRIADTAEALRVYARRAQWGLDAQNRCCEKSACWRNGSLASRSRPGCTPADRKWLRKGDHFRLADIGITKRLSSRAQALAAIPLAIFNEYIGEVCGDGDELTARGLLNHAERQTQPDRNRENIVGGQVGGFADLGADEPGWLHLDRPCLENSRRDSSV